MTVTTALVLKETNVALSLKQVQLQKIRPDEALVEIHATGICHTDISIATGVLPYPTPSVLGHEGAGVVKEVGSNVTDISPGDTVLLSFAHCKTCDECKSGHPAYCHTFILLNYSGTRPDGSNTMSIDGGDPLYGSFFGQSSFARHAIVAGTSLIKVPHGTDLALLAPLGCGMQTGAGAIMNTLDVQAGKTVAVFGVGSVGMSAVIAAKIRGAKTIIAVDLLQNRLDLATELGATHTLLGDDSELRKKLLSYSSPFGVDYAVDCSGVTAVIETMISCLGIRGKGASVGVAKPGTKIGVDLGGLVTRGSQYLGCCVGDAEPHKFIPFLINEHAKGNFPLEKLVTLYDAESFQQAIDDTSRGTTLKAVLVWKR